MKQSLGDLNQYLFEQLDVLSNPDLKGKELKEEILRAKTIANVAREIINNADVVLKAQKFSTEYVKEVPELLEG